MRDTFTTFPRIQIPTWAKILIWIELAFSEMEMASENVIALDPRVASLNSKPRRLWAQKQLVNKGEPTTDLNIPLTPWRKGTITGALALAGFMVNHITIFHVHIDSIDHIIRLA